MTVRPGPSWTRDWRHVLYLQEFIPTSVHNKTGPPARAEDLHALLLISKSANEAQNHNTRFAPETIVQEQTKDAGVLRPVCLRKPTYPNIQNTSLPAWNDSKPTSGILFKGPDPEWQNTKAIQNTQDTLNNPTSDRPSTYQPDYYIHMTPHEVEQLVRPDLATPRSRRGFPARTGGTARSRFPMLPRVPYYSPRVHAHQTHGDWIRRPPGICITPEEMAANRLALMGGDKGFVW